MLGGSTLYEFWGQLLEDSGGPLKGTYRRTVSETNDIPTTAVGLKATHDTHSPPLLTIQNPLCPRLVALLVSGDSSGGDPDSHP